MLAVEKLSGLQAAFEEKEARLKEAKRKAAEDGDNIAELITSEKTVRGLQSLQSRMVHEGVMILGTTGQEVEAAVVHATLQGAGQDVCASVVDVVDEDGTHRVREQLPTGVDEGIVWQSSRLIAIVGFRFCFREDENLLRCLYLEIDRYTSGPAVGCLTVKLAHIAGPFIRRVEEFVSSGWSATRVKSGPKPGTAATFFSNKPREIRVNRKGHGRAGARIRRPRGATGENTAPQTPHRRISSPPHVPHVRPVPRAERGSGRRRPDQPEAMSWLRNAVHRAVEASGGRSSLLTRTVRTSLDTVVHHAGQAVAGGARLINDRIVGNHRYYKSLKLTAKRLEEAALSYRGEERVQLLRRWLVALKETERAVAAMREPPRHADDPNQAVPVLDLYVDYENGDEPMNFFHVFLYSQALERVVLSMILEAPTEEEGSLLLEIFGMCLNGGKDVHNGILSSIHELAKLFSSYNDEVLAKRDELLQFAQCAISGLKINAEIARLDGEIVQLQQQIHATDVLRSTSTSNRNKASQTVTEGFKHAVAEVRLCSRMEELVLRKKSIHPGDSLETHFQKVDKLKVLSESLSNSSAKAEKRITENRLQKEESLIFRVTKTNEVSEIEKKLVAEISGLEKEKDQLEAELKKVNTKLHAAVVKLKKTREERDQFDEASNQIVLHLKAKEDELSRSIASCKVEASTVRAWINFLEDTWKLQSLYEEIKEKQANDELDRCRVCFVNLIKHHVSACVEELSTSIDRIKTFVDNLTIFSDRSVSAEDGDNDPSKQSNPRKYLEEEYLETEKKVVAAFSLADNIRALTFPNPDSKARREDPEVKSLFATMDKLRVEFESVPRPVLQIEIREKEEKPRRTRSLSFKGAGTPSHSGNESPIAAQLRTRLPSESDSELAKFDQEYKADDISGWEFDELEDELRSGFE